MNRTDMKFMVTKVNLLKNSGYSIAEIQKMTGFPEAFIRACIDHARKLKETK